MAREFLASSSQSISVASAPSINFGSGDFTVFAWVRFPTAPPDDSMIVGKRAGGFDGDEGWELKFNDGGNETIRWDVETDITGRQRAEGTATNITDGNWHLIAGDHTDAAPTGQIRIWYDGAVLATKVANTPGTVNTATPLVIGAAYNIPNTNYITGEMAVVFGCTRILSLAEHEMMAAGFSPRFLRPTPCFLMELTSRASPEPDIAGGLSGTLENAPAFVDSPRIIYPVEPSIGQDLWYEYANATVVGQSSLTVTMTRGRTASATSDGQSALTADVTAAASMEATVVGQSGLTADMHPEAPLQATVGAQSALSAAANIAAGVGAEVEGQSNLSASLSAELSISSTVAGQSSLTSSATVTTSAVAQVDGQSALTSDATRGRSVSCSIGTQSLLTSAATISASAGAVVSGQSAGTAALSATVPVFASIVSESSIVADLAALVPVATTVSGASTVGATVTRARRGEATVVGQSTLVADTRALVLLAADILALSSLSAKAVANVRPSATVAGESTLTARPTYPGVQKTITVGGVMRWLKTVGGRIRA